MVAVEYPFVEMNGPSHDVPALPGDPDEGAPLVARRPHVETGEGHIVDLARTVGSWLECASKAPKNAQVLEVGASTVETFVDCGLSACP
eukprot:scaffold36361_cov64-Phaeocystis_antarctica.AAC.5